MPKRFLIPSESVTRVTSDGRAQDRNGIPGRPIAIVPRGLWFTTRSDDTLAAESVAQRATGTSVCVGDRRRKTNANLGHVSERNASSNATSSILVVQHYNNIVRRKILHFSFDELHDQDCSCTRCRDSPSFCSYKRKITRKTIRSILVRLRFKKRAISQPLPQKGVGAAPC